MATTEVSQSLIVDYNKAMGKPSPFSRFFTWCGAQQHNRLLWLGIALTTHCCVITPLTLLAVLTSTANFFLISVAILTMEIVFVTNLTVGSTKINLPLYFGSIGINLLIILYSVSQVIF